MLRSPSYNQQIIEIVYSHTTKVHQAGELFKTVLLGEGNMNLREIVDGFDIIEQEADELILKANMIISRSFILSFDKQDIKELIEFQDDIIDSLGKSIYLLEAVHVEYMFFAEIITLVAKGCGLVKKAGELLYSKKLSDAGFITICHELVSLEQDIDVLVRKLQIRIFDELTGDKLLSYKLLLDSLDVSSTKLEKLAVSYQSLQLKYT